MLERTTRWVLQNVDTDTSPARIVDQNLKGLARLRESFHEFVAGEERTLFQSRVGEILDVGADELFSKRLMTLRFLDQLLEVLAIAREKEVDEVVTGRAYYSVSASFEVPWLRRTTFASAGDDRWEQRAAQVLSEDLSRAHRQLVRAVVSRTASTADVGAALDEVLAEHPSQVVRFSGVLAEIKGEDAVGLAAMSVAVRELSALAGRVS